MSSNPKDPIVASLANRASHPYSSLTLSPDRRYAIAAGKDTLRVVSISPDGLKEVRSLRISQHFQGSAGRQQAGGSSQLRTGGGGDVRGLYRSSAPSMAATSANVVVTDIAWSPPQQEQHQQQQQAQQLQQQQQQQQQQKESAEIYSSVVAASGSNGVVVVWPAHSILSTQSSTSSVMGPAPEAVLRQHTRAINRMAWNQKRPGWLLTGSQDSTVRLWERRPSLPDTPNPQQQQKLLSWFGMQNNPALSNRSYSWRCLATFEPKSEAVRDIKWNPFNKDVFAVVTDTGSLVVYNAATAARPWFRVNAHDGEATTVDWHPTKRYVIATGGAQDRTVKVWDLERNMSQSEEGSLTSLGSSTDELPSRQSTVSSLSGASISSGQPTIKSAAKTLSVSAAVTRLRWRFPSGRHAPSTNIHEHMIAVSTAPVMGASAGGNGVLSLWSQNRPFMALSVLEGHKDGSVTDFKWMDSPPIPIENVPAQLDPRKPEKMQFTSAVERKKRSSSTGSTLSYSPQASFGKLMHDADEVDNGSDQQELTTEGTWQHVLSVGRDGMVLLQSFARGYRPVSRVPPSCFALANLSPFQSGYGSLQIFSIHQSVPSGLKHDFALTGLRRDAAMSHAPGVFREANLSAESGQSPQPMLVNQQLPAATPKMVFNVIDQGDLTDDATPVDSHPSVLIAPEVVHLSRFANSYKLYPDPIHPTSVSLCQHNADVAKRLQRQSLARMWRMVSSLLRGAGVNQLPIDTSNPKNALQFALLPTVRDLLEERANVGDVQTCVALCEILCVLSDASDSTETHVPGLDLELVREWYLSYIDILHQMCLFSNASALIRLCKDPIIGALNQQSTIIHESCPRCGKAILETSERDNAETGVARRTCRNCRSRISMCFLCHEPVKGMFVWCPGCGHGGHLDHALQWFGGMNGKAVREVCPTGCGHRCNIMQQLRAFPVTERVTPSSCLPAS